MPDPTTQQATGNQPMLMNILLGLMRALAQMRQQEIAGQREEASIQNPQYRLQLQNAMKRKSRAIAESIGVPAEFGLMHPMAPDEDEDEYRRRLAKLYSHATGLDADKEGSFEWARRQKRAARAKDKARAKREARLQPHDWRMQWKMPGHESQVRSSVPMDQNKALLLRLISRKYSPTGTYPGG